MDRHLVWAAILIGMMLFPGWTHANNENLLLYNSQTGEGVVAKIQGNEFKKLKSYGQGAFAKWTHVSLAEDQHGLLFYNAETGVWVSGELDHGTFTTEHDARADFSKGWTHIVDLGLRRPKALPFFYNQQTGVGAVGYNPTVKEYKAGELLQGWTHIVANKTGILFYNSATGAGAVAIPIDPDAAPGAFSSGPAAIKTVADYAPGDFASHWTNIVATDTELLFYNSADGSGALGRFVGHGNDKRFETTKPIKKGGFSSGWTHAVSAPGSNKILFYQSQTGLAALGELSNGQFSTIRKYDKNVFGPGWTHVVAAAQDSKPKPPIR